MKFMWNTAMKKCTKELSLQDFPCFLISVGIISDSPNDID